MTTKPELKRVKPEDMEFEPGKIYYVRRRGSPTVEPMQCVASGRRSWQTGFGMDWAKTKRRTGRFAFGPTGLYSNVCLDTDIEVVYTGVPDEILHEANRRAVWGN